MIPSAGLDDLGLILIGFKGERLLLKPIQGYNLGYNIFLLFVVIEKNVNSQIKKKMFSRATSWKHTITKKKKTFFKKFAFKYKRQSMQNY